MAAPDMGHVAASSITLRGVRKSYDATEVIPPLTVDLRAGEFTVVLGPSGCGKSTLLQMIAGLERVSGGTIAFGDRPVQDLEPKRRGCAMVFQNYALYPHMSVFGNIAYSLRIAGVSKADQQERVGRVARMLALEGLLERRPGQLSGGQRQRVAIGRAIVREPSVLLFDEPLSNLDAQLRHDMRIELTELHERIGATTVFVTHDQVEAMTLADRILVLNKGRIEQFGTPGEIYHAPASEFVARFIGSPPMNVVPVVGDGTHLRTPAGTALARSAVSGKAMLGFRPEDVVIGGDGAITVRRRHVEDLGSHAILNGEIDPETPVRVVAPFGQALGDAESYRVTLPAAKLHLFDGETGKVIPGAFSQQQ